MNYSPALEAEPFQKFVRMLPPGWSPHLDPDPTFEADVEGLHNQIQSIRHRSFGFRNAEHFIAAIYPCCA
jgi:hypothetical protein